MSETLDRYLELKHQIQTEEIPKLTDETIPLEKRWELYEKLATAGVLGKNSCGDGYLDVLDPTDSLSLYDDFNVDRHQTVTYLKLYKKILAANASAAKYEEPLPYTQEAIDDWREEVLFGGDSEMVYDW